MTSGTIVGKPHQLVVRLGGGSIGFRVTSVAIHRCTGVLLTGIADMAGLTVCNRMCPSQGKSPCGMQVQIILPIFPVARCVTVLAIGAELPVVLIGMAIYAGCPYLAEDRTLVATGTRSGSVSAEQRKTGRRMVKKHTVAHF